VRSNATGGSPAGETAVQRWPISVSSFQFRGNFPAIAEFNPPNRMAREEIVPRVKSPKIRRRVFKYSF
jgi:hypothetical protein